MCSILGKIIRKMVADNTNTHWISAITAVIPPIQGRENNIDVRTRNLSLRGIIEFAGNARGSYM